jgi:hypothetical protein
MGTVEVIGGFLSIVEGLDDPATVNTVLVVASYLAFLKVILRTWEQKLLASGPMLKSQRVKSRR